MDFSKLPPEILAKLTPEQMEEMRRQGDYQNELIGKHIHTFGALIEKTIAEIGDGHAGPVILEILAIFAGQILAKAPAALHPMLLPKTIEVIIGQMNDSRPPGAKIKLSAVGEEEDDIKVQLH